jgi:hypothetical protein
VRPDAPAEPEDLLEEARRRQLRRCLAAGVAGVALLAGVAGVVAGFAGHPRSRASSRSHPEKKTAVRRVIGAPAPIPRNIGTTLLMWPVGYPACGQSGGPPV